jgi:hypothetical protein
MEIYIIVIFILLLLFVSIKKENFNQDDFIKKTVNYYYDEYNNKLTTNCTKKIISDPRNNTYCKNNQISVNNLANLYDNSNFLNIKHNSMYYSAYSKKYIPIKISSPDWYHNKN